MANTDSSVKDPAQKFEPSDELLATVEKNMAKADMLDVDIPAEDDSTPVTPAESTTSEDDTTVDVATTPVPTEPEPTTTPEKEAEVVLPDAYRRAAIHQEWTPEEVDSFFQQDPEKALKTFKSIYTSTNRISQQWANAGQVKRNVANATPVEPKSVAPMAPQSGVDLSKLEDDGVDDSVLEAIKQMDTRNSTLQARVDELSARPVVQPSSGADDDLLEREVHQFFSDKTLMADSDHYGIGKEWGDLTPNQQEHRRKVLATGDNLIVGASIHGQVLTNAQALEQAHLLEAAPSLEAETVADIKKTLTKREQNLDFQPTAALVPVKTPKDEEAGVIARAAKGLKKLYGKN